MGAGRSRRRGGPVTATAERRQAEFEGLLGQCWAEAICAARRGDRAGLERVREVLETEATDALKRWCEAVVNEAAERLGVAGGAEHEWLRVAIWATLAEATKRKG